MIIIGCTLKVFFTSDLVSHELNTDVTCEQILTSATGILLAAAKIVQTIQEVINVNATLVSNLVLIIIRVKVNLSVVIIFRFCFLNSYIKS